MNDAPDINKALKGIDPEQIPLPEGLEDRLWERLNSRDDFAENTLAARTLGPESSADAELVISEEEPPDTASRFFPWAAALVLVALLGAFAAQAFGGSESTELASTPEPADEQAEAPTTTPDATVPDTAVPEATDTIEVGFDLFPVVSESTRTSLMFDFATNSDSVFNATLWEGSRVVATTGGSAGAGEVTAFLFEDLADSTQYEVEVVLIGNETVRSGRILARTAGDTALELTDLQVNAESNEISFTTNLCATTSYVVLTADDRREVARGEVASGGDCSLEHSLRPDLSTIGTGATEFLVIIEALSVESSSLTSSTTATVTVATEQSE